MIFSMDLIFCYEGGGSIRSLKVSLNQGEGRGSNKKHFHVILFFSFSFLLYITIHGDFGLVVLHFNPLAPLPSLLAQTLHVSFSYYSQALLNSTQSCGTNVVHFNSNHTLYSHCANFNCAIE